LIILKLVFAVTETSVHTDEKTQQMRRQRTTRNSGDPLNLRVNHGRLEIRRNFFSVRVMKAGTKYLLT
jgi:hypothetical protein